MEAGERNLFTNEIASRALDFSCSGAGIDLHESHFGIYLFIYIFLSFFGFGGGVRKQMS